MGAKAQGGFYGWWLLFFLWIAYTLSVGCGFYSPVVIFPYMIEEMEWSRGEIMFGFTAIMMLMGIAGPLAAWMVGRFGARVTMVTGGAIVAVGAFLIGLVGHDDYVSYVVLCVIIGLGLGLASIIPIQTVIVAWFNTRRALALGLVMGGGAIGGFAAPQIISVAVQDAGGDWRFGWFIIAIALVIGMIVTIFAVHTRPEDLGQHPDGITPAEAKANADAYTGRKTRTYRTTTNWTVRDAVRTNTFWLLIVAKVSTTFLWQVVSTQTPLHLQDRGFDPTMAAFFYSLAVGLSVVGRFSIAVLGDIIEPRSLFTAGAFCTLAGSVLFWFVSPAANWTAYLYPLLAGFGSGVVYVCIPNIISNYWGTEAFASINGLLLPIIVVLQAMAAPLAGFLYDLQGTYLNVMFIAWTLAAIGLAAIFFCRPPQPKEKA